MDVEDLVMITWATAAPAVSAAFLGSMVEVVEAFTIILAVGTVSGWRPALAGTAAGLTFLAVLVLALGPLLQAIPLHALQLVIGVLLLLFGLRWLRKAILRGAGILPLHDETAAFASETAGLRARSLREASRAAWIAAIAAFKAVVLEGIEVVFIVIAVGAGRGLLWPASLGALAACLLVLAIGLLVHRPLSRVPENTLKFGVGVMLSAFGLFWTGEGLGVGWPGEDLAILGFILLFLAVGLGAVARLRRPKLELV
jgi:Ca2+/H+ antiporter, TMEM165/GDT1 family